MFCVYCYNLLYKPGLLGCFNTFFEIIKLLFTYRNLFNSISICFESYKYYRLLKFYNESRDN